jgi:glycine hydroxymethyltransferase
MAVLFASLQPQDAILAMDLKHGGHLSHGSPVNFSGILYDVYSYGVDKKTERIDFDQVREKARACRPKLIIIGASSYPRMIPFEPFREIANEVGAKLMADVAHYAGLIVAGLFPNPVPFCDYVTLTTHKTLRGPRGGVILTNREFAKEIDKSVFPGIQGGPLMNVVAAKAVAFLEASQDSFRDYQMSVVENAKTMARVFEEAGIRLVSGGTDTHMILLDVSSLGLNGKEAERLLEDVGITTNKNVIPFDPLPPSVTSGIRIGTPAITTRGFTQESSKEVARLIVDVLKSRGEASLLKCIHGRISELCESFPLYP